MLICPALNLPCVANLRCDFALHCEILPCIALHRTLPCIEPTPALNLRHALNALNLTLR